VQFGENRHHIGDAAVAGTQPRNLLGNRRSQDDQMSTIMWKKYKIGKRTESKEKKKNSDARRGEDSKIGNR